jgi:hypothetical protein
MLAALLLACGGSAEAPRAQSPAAVDSTKAALGEPDDEMVGLLAVKYTLDSATVAAITRAYMRKVDFMYRLSDTRHKTGRSALPAFYAPKAEVIGAVDSLAVAYNVPRSQLAALLIDFRISQAVNHSSEETHE